MQDNYIRISYLDIIKTFSTLLYDHFDIPVMDVLEDYDRACFMTNLDVRRSERFMTRHIIDYMTMTIYYFPEDRENNTAEIAIMREKLRDLFLIELNSLIPTNDRLPLEIIDYFTGVYDDVLQFRIDMSMVHEIVGAKGEDNKENMEKLFIDTTVNDSNIGTVAFQKDDREDDLDNG